MICPQTSKEAIHRCWPHKTIAQGLKQVWSSTRPQKPLISRLAFERGLWDPMRYFRQMLLRFIREGAKKSEWPNREAYKYGMPGLKGFKHDRFSMSMLLKPQIQGVQPSYILQRLSTLVACLSRYSTCSAILISLKEVQCLVSINFTRKDHQIFNGIRYLLSAISRPSSFISTRFRTDDA